MISGRFVSILADHQPTLAREKYVYILDGSTFHLAVIIYFIFYFIFVWLHEQQVREMKCECNRVDGICKKKMKCQGVDLGTG